MPKTGSDSYNLWAALDANCTESMNNIDYTWTSENVQRDRQMNIKRCVMGMKGDALDDVILDIQEFTTNLMNAANFANCLCGVGRVHDVKQWWKIALRSPCS
jgi:hypothetical protein